MKSSFTIRKVPFLFGIILFIMTDCKDGRNNQKDISNQLDLLKYDTTQYVITIGPTHLYQQTILSLPDTSFQKLIDSCSLSFTIKDSTSKDTLYKRRFKIKEHNLTLTISKDLLSPKNKFYFSVFWIPKKIESTKKIHLSGRETMAFLMLKQFLNGIDNKVIKTNNPFKEGLSYTEEFNPIYCTIDTDPQDAEIYLIPRYYWDFYLEMPGEFTEENINPMILQKLSDYKLPRNTILRNYAVSETVYVVILGLNNKYKLLTKFSPSPIFLEKNVVKQKFTK